MKRVGALFATLLTLALIIASVAQAWHPATPTEIRELSATAGAPVRDARISKLDENWAAASYPSPPISLWGYFRFRAGIWEAVAGSSGCLMASEIPGIPTAVARELGACPFTKPAPTIPYTYFAVASESQLSENPSSINFAASACAPLFFDLEWTRLAFRHAIAVGRGRFPYFPTYETSCLEAPAHYFRLHLVALRPRPCEGGYVFTELRWRAGPEKGHYRGRCRSPY